MFVVPHGDPYMMASAPDLRPGMRAEAVLEFFRQMATQSGPLEVHEGGGGSPRAQVVCGFLGCDIRPFNPVLEALASDASSPASERGTEQATGCRS